MPTAEAACVLVTPPNIVSCDVDPGNYPAGIDYQNETTAVPNLNLTLQNGVLINNSIGQDGVSLEQSGNLTLTTQGAADINILGAATDRDGIRVDSINGNVTINSNANITTNNVLGDGIIARSNSVDNENPNFSTLKARGTGSVSVTSSGTISTTANTSTGITAGAAGALVSVVTTGNITTLGASESGAIVATNYRPGGSGNTAVTVSGANLSTLGTQSGGIIATAASGATVINVTGGSVSTQGFQSIGIGGGSGLTNLLAVGPGLFAPIFPIGTGVSINNGTLAAPANDGANINTTGNWGLGISAISRGGPIAILNRGAITTSGDVGVGISALNTFLPLGAAPAITITNQAVITTRGGSAAGIAALAVASPITITSSGAITTTGNTITVPEFSSLGLTLTAAGIQATGLGGGAISIATTAGGTINTSGANADGINAIGASGAITATANAAIATTGTESDGIEARNTSAGGSGAVTVNANATISASGQFSSGIVGISRNAAANVNVAAGVDVMGGWSAVPGAPGPINGLPAAGVIIGGTPTTSIASIAALTNNGRIAALSDLAIAAASLVPSYLPPNGGVRVDNNGTISGFLTLTPTTGVRQNVFNNNAGALFDVRNFADTTGDGARDVKAVSVSNFGGPNAVFNNAGTVRLADIVGATTINTSGQYLPAYTTDAAFYDTNRAGVEQGRFDNLQTFTHSGIITMQEATGTVAGDILKIGAAGGTGTFISNGGALFLDTVLNQGGPANSHSDVLVVDGTTLGTAATRLYVRNAGGAGAPTVGNGILVVEVLDATRSASGAFVLGQAVSAGAYNYGLFQNAVDGSVDGDWYLRSSQRMETGLYTALPAIAARFGVDALGTMHERTGDKTDDPSARNGAWARVIGRVRNAERDGTSVESHTGLFQIGLDLLRLQHDNGMHDDAGLYFLNGTLRANVDRTTPLGSVNLNANGIGGYWTRVGPSGWYLDLVGQYTWFANTFARSAEGTALSSGGSSAIASIEGGLPVQIATGWSLEAQAQLVYQHVDLNAGRDAVAQVSFPAFDQYVGRIGGRLVRDSGAGLNTWLRGNIWHQFDGDATTSFATLQGQNATLFPTAFGETWGQVGAGVTWKIPGGAVFANGDYEFSVSNAGDGYSGRVGFKAIW